jgi:Kef-type K+ transport system membrane component KefB
MNYYDVLLPIALILILSKALGILCKKIGVPQVVGMLLAGLILGLVNMIPGVNLVDSTAKEGLSFIAKIGVVLILFSAGLETDLKQIKATGVASIIITCLGVILPMALGFVVAALFNGGFVGMTKAKVISNLFYGTILTATSVSVTVATLKELNQLQSKVGTSIVSAAILDDIIGVVILSFMISMGKDISPVGTADASAKSPWVVVLLTLAFFVFVFVSGFIIRKLFNYYDKKEHHHRRIPIYGIAICFLFAYLAEKLFGIADITGAYFAGLILSDNNEKNYIDRRSDIISYLLFSPVFFANIGLTTDFSHMNLAMVGFGLCFVAAGLLGKFIGCGVGALTCKYSLKESVRVGLGMMCRAEVCLICAQKGVDCGLVDPNIMPFIILLIIITSFSVPMLLKLTYKNELGSKPKEKEETVQA